MNPISAAVNAFDRTVAAARDRSGLFDHLWRAKERYGDVLGGRLAAAIAYYGFFATFALGLVAFSIMGFLLEHNVDLRSTVEDFIREHFPVINPDELENAGDDVLSARSGYAIVGLLGLTLTGIGWVEAIRSSQRLIWDLDEQPGNVVIRRLVDLAVLVGTMILLGLSVAATDAIESVIVWFVGPGAGLVVTATSWLFVALVNVVLAALLLAAVPRLRMPARRLLPSVALVAVGITVLNSVGRYYIELSARRPAYAVLATTVTVLVYLYLFNQLLLFAAAIAATSQHGSVVDLAAGPPPNDEGSADVPADTEGAAAPRSG